MTLSTFLSALKGLQFIDRDQLVHIGALDADDGAGWQAFRTDPFRWMMRAGDDAALRVWGLLSKVPSLDQIGMVRDILTAPYPAPVPRIYTPADLAQWCAEQSINPGLSLEDRERFTQAGSLLLSIAMKEQREGRR